MLRSAFWKTLRDLRRTTCWWSLGIVALSAFMVAVYPSVRDNPDLNKMVEDYPEALKAFFGLGQDVDYTSAVGYLNSELFSLMAPLLLLIAGIGAGARATAGEEERGTLDLLLANPISRRRLVAEKFAALVVQLTLLGAVLWLSLVVGCRVVGMHLSAVHLGAAATATVLLAVAFGAVALLLGAWLGSRSAAIGITAAAAVAAYLLSSLAEVVDFLKPLRGASPFYHYIAQDALRAGLGLDHVALLVALTIAASTGAVAAFSQRDLHSP